MMTTRYLNTLFHQLRTRDFGADEDPDVGVIETLCGICNNITEENAVPSVQQVVLLSELADQPHRGVDGAIARMAEGVLESALQMLAPKEMRKLIAETLAPLTDAVAPVEDRCAALRRTHFFLPHAAQTVADEALPVLVPFMLKTALPEETAEATRLTRHILDETNWVKGEALFQQFLSAAEDASRPGALRREALYTLARIEEDGNYLPFLSKATAARLSGLGLEADGEMQNLAKGFHHALIRNGAVRPSSVGHRGESVSLSGLSVAAGF